MWSLVRPPIATARSQLRLLPSRSPILTNLAAPSSRALLFVAFFFLFVSLATTEVPGLLLAGPSVGIATSLRARPLPRVLELMIFLRSPSTESLTLLLPPRDRIPKRRASIALFLSRDSYNSILRHVMTQETFRASPTTITFRQARHPPMVLLADFQIVTDSLSLSSLLACVHVLEISRCPPLL